MSDTFEGLEIDPEDPILNADPPPVEDDEPDIIIDDEPEPEPEPEPEDKVSPGVQKRLDQMTFKYREEERQRLAVEQRLAAMEERVTNVQKTSSQQTQKNFDEQYETTRAQAIKATEDGDTEAAFAAQERLADMRAIRQQALMRQREAQEQQQQYRQQQQQYAPAQEQPPTEAMNWFHRNRWFNSEGNEAKTEVARRIDNDLTEIGFDKNHPGYYTELDKRLNSEYGNGQPRRSGSSPTAPATRSTSTVGKGGPLRLTAAEREIAEQLGITGKDALEDYAKEVRRMKNG